MVAILSMSPLPVYGTIEWTELAPRVQKWTWPHTSTLEHSCAVHQCISINSVWLTEWEE